VDKDISIIQTCITNRLDATGADNHGLAGVIGDAPSYYSKSPALWNAAFQALNLDVVYLPFDVAEPRLKELISAFRDCQSLLGVNVTVPHKLKVIEFLDELDAEASRVQAVNAIVRTPNGRLIGSNTDGQGFVKSILEPQPGNDHGFIPSLTGIDVLLLGAGGSARAVAYAVAERLISGQLVICNRTLDHAQALAQEIKHSGNNARAINEEELLDWAPRTGLIINCTIKGQGGMPRSEIGGVMSMELYSALAPARPAAVPESKALEVDSHNAVERLSRSDIEKNNDLSLRVASSIPKACGFYDLIYFPEETIFLRHGRLTGHKTQNGKGMIICQAAIAFYTLICRQELQSRNIDNPDTYRRILDIMYRAW